MNNNSILNNNSESELNRIIIAYYFDYDKSNILTNIILATNLLDAIIIGNALLLNATIISAEYENIETINTKHVKLTHLNSN